MRHGLLALALPLLAMGCTAFAVQERTVNQISSVTDMRYREVLHAIAMVAANPSVLPPFSLLADGQTQVTDIGSLSSITKWERALGFSSEELDAMVSRNPSQNWTLSMVAEWQKMAAIRACCQWVVEGPDSLSPESLSLLRSLEEDPSPGPHFGVARGLAALPPCWVHVGRHKDVPRCACYKAHCGKTWAWVTPDDLQGLSDFTLILMDIATVEIGALYHPELTADVVIDNKDKLGRPMTLEQEIHAEQHGNVIQFGSVDEGNLPVLQMTSNMRTAIGPLSPATTSPNAVSSHNSPALRSLIRAR